MMAYKTLTVLLMASLMCVFHGTADLIDELELLKEHDVNSGKATVSTVSISGKCFYENQRYEVGAKFADASCTKLCTCLTGGHVLCASLCVRRSTSACTYDSHMVMEPIPSEDPTGRCKCDRTACVPRLRAPVGKCLIEGKEHSIGHQFADNKCAGWCTCLPGGNVACRPLCPRGPAATCTGANSQLRPKMVPSRDPTGKCKCLRFVCGLRPPEKCSFEGNEYNISAKFANRACTSSCTCARGGEIQCVSMCPPMPSPMCSFRSHLLIKEVPSADPTGRCKCQHSICAPAQTGTGRCILEGRSYKANEAFIDQKCLGDCRCLPHGGVMCFPLCPRSGVMCTFEEQVKGRRPMDKEGRCFCKCDEGSIAV